MGREDEEDLLRAGLRAGRRAQRHPLANQAQPPPNPQPCNQPQERKITKEGKNPLISDIDSYLFVDCFEIELCSSLS